MYCPDGHCRPFDADANGTMFSDGCGVVMLKRLDEAIEDRDQIYGGYFSQRVTGLGIEQVLTAPRSPWQSPHVERVIGSIRR